VLPERLIFTGRRVVRAGFRSGETHFDKVEAARASNAVVLPLAVEFSRLNPVLPA
jgi:hypothetical protein